MSSLSQNVKSGTASDLILESVTSNAFQTLLLAIIDGEETESLEAKMQALRQLGDCAEQLECDLENKATFFHWTAIASAFGTAAVITASATLNPLVGFLVAGVSASSAAASVGGAMLHNKEAMRVIDQLKRVRVVIGDGALLDWACLWGLTGFELFCKALLAGSKGNLSDFGISRPGKINALTVAVRFAAQARGLDVDAMVSQLGEIKNGVRPQLVEKIQEAVKAALPPVKEAKHATPTKPVENIVIGGESVILAERDAFKEMLDSIAPQSEVEKTVPTSNNYQWIDQVLKMPFRVLTGDAGSGKSTLERFMISKLKEAGYHIVCLNTETNPDVWKGVEVLTTSTEINDFLSDFVAGIENRQRECRKLGIDEDEFLAKVAANKTGRNGRVAIFFMEANTFELCGVDADLWASVLQMCLTNIRKWGYTACLTAQSDNQTSISSKMKGFSSRYDEQPRVECIVKTDDVTGEAVSSGRAWLKVKGKADKNPKSINLANFPKTKDFRTQAEKEAPVDTTPPYPKAKTQPERKLSDIINSLEKSLEISDKDSADEVTKPQEKVTDADVDLTDDAYLIDEWLEKNRVDTWVKFKGKKDRDSSFVNFLSESNIKGEDKDKAITELFLAKKIELSDDGFSLRWLGVSP